MKLRNQTAQEKAKENAPRCPYDPLQTTFCNHYEFPPKQKKCQNCLIVSIADGLEYKTPSEAMRWFIAYKKFMKTEDAEKCLKR